VILAWLLRHPSNILPIIGSTQPARILAALQSLNLDYSREDWYRLLEARNGKAVA
jgi:predicted oxidoreductase